MARFDADLRWGPAGRPIPTESEPALVERIRAEIAQTGPLTFARFMELALYDPDRGYYRSAAERPGREGDFLTAPDLHPVFGAAIARQLDEVWRRLDEPDRFVLREYGPGSGSLALAALRALAGQGPMGSVTGSPGLAAAIRYAPIEVNAHRLAQLTDRLAAAGFGPTLEPGLDAGRPEPGVVVANEFLDALPVHRLTVIDGRLRELYVDRRADAFVEVVGDPSTPALEDRLAGEGITLAEGARAEVCLAIDRWVDEAASGLERGLVLVIDYGHPAATLYGPERAAGTLMAYAGHRAHDDWTVAVGRQDLTAHVDFSAVERRARADGLAVLGLTSQAEFLIGVGTEALVDAIRSDPDTTFEDRTALRSALGRLLDPRAMGGFRALCLGRGLAAEPALAGLAFRIGRG
jgi:SAM-dependent MidA family methyltransferase